MSDVKWIKMSTGLPDNKKLKQIRTLPNGDTIALMWVFLLCLAGNVNEQGLIYITPEVPYTDEMLAEEFRMDVNTIRLGLATFQKFGMLEIINDVICVSAWEKWQSTDRLSEIREYNRLAKQRSRAKQKSLADVNDKSMTSQRCHDTDKDIDIDKEEDKEKEHSKECSKPKRPPKVKYGVFKNVLLTAAEYEKLELDFGNIYTVKAIDFLDSYIEEKGYKSKSHNLAIRRWVMDAVKERESKPKKAQTYPTRKEMVPDWMDSDKMKTRIKKNDKLFEELGIEDEIKSKELNERVERLKESLAK